VLRNQVSEAIGIARISPHEKLDGWTSASVPQASGVSERWRLRAPAEPTGMPLIVLLESRAPWILSQEPALALSRPRGDDRRLGGSDSEEPPCQATETPRSAIS
jgi:hypothetical protein